MPDEPVTPNEGNEEFSISPEEWEEVTETMGLIREAMQNAPQEQTEETQDPQSPQLDPLDPSFDQNLENYIQQRVDASIAPYQGFTQEQIMSEAEERAMDIIDSLASEKGDLPQGGAEFVRAIANDYIEESQQKFGFGPQAAEDALSRAYDHAQEVFKAAGKAYYDQTINELSTLDQAPREPATNVPAQQGNERVKGTEQDLVRAFFPTR